MNTENQKKTEIQRFQNLIGAIHHELVPGIHTYHECECGKRGTRKGKCPECLLKEYRNIVVISRIGKKLREILQEVSMCELLEELQVYCSEHPEVPEMVIEGDHIKACISYITMRYKQLPNNV